MNRILIFSAVVAILVGYFGLAGSLLDLDISLVRLTGSTFFDDARVTSLKEVHLGQNEPDGKRVVVKGSLYSMGRFFTHMVVKDSGSKVLVVLTDIADSEIFSNLESGQKVKILGSVENGKKGYPYILAKSVNVVTKHQIR